MSIDACRELRGDLAAYGAERLEAEHRIRLIAHLDGCAECRSELAPMRATMAMLQQVDVRRLDDDVVAPAGLDARVLQKVQRERTAIDERTAFAMQDFDTGRKQRRHAATRLRIRVATAVCIAAVFAGVLVVVVERRTPASITTRTVALTAFERGATGSVRLTRAANGTTVAFRAAGLDAGHTYWLWITDKSGNRFGAGTVVAGVGGQVDVNSVGSLDFGRIHRVWVTEVSQGTVLDSTRF